MLYKIFNQKKKVIVRKNDNDSRPRKIFHQNQDILL